MRHKKKRAWKVEIGNRNQVLSCWYVSTIEKILIEIDREIDRERDTTLRLPAMSAMRRKTHTTPVRIGLGWIGLDWTGLDWTGLDWTGLDWTRLD